jgi:hypothetical protein
LYRPKVFPFALAAGHAGARSAAKKFCTVGNAAPSAISMRRSVLLIVFCATAAFLMWAQRDRPADRPAYEVKSLMPRETAPAQYKQVDAGEIQNLASDGWELVAVVPYIYKNEERGTPDLAPRPMVTQVYPAYFFKRLRTVR